MATKSWLKNNNIEFTEKSIDNNVFREELLSLGYKSTPVIITESGAIIGFNPTQLSKALK